MASGTTGRGGQRRGWQLEKKKKQKEKKKRKRKEKEHTSCRASWICENYRTETFLLFTCCCCAVCPPPREGKKKEKKRKKEPVELLLLLGVEGEDESTGCSWGGGGGDDGGADSFPALLACFLPAAAMTGCGPPVVRFAIAFFPSLTGVQRYLSYTL